MAVDSTHVVFGGTGGIGGAVVAELLRRGQSVRAVSRGGDAPDGAEGAAADAADAAEAAVAASGAAVVYHCVSPPYTQWPELLPPVSRSILGAAESSGAKLVFADNLYAYGPVDLPATASGRKGRTRVEVAAEMLAAHAEGRVRVTIGRASDYYGRGGRQLDLRGDGLRAGSGRVSGLNGPGNSTFPTPFTTCPTSLAGSSPWLSSPRPTVRSATAGR